MREWLIDFSGYCVVQAENKEQAEWDFYENINPPCDSPIYNEWYFVKNIEMVEPRVKQLSMFDEEE